MCNFFRSDLIPASCFCALFSPNKVKFSVQYFILTQKDDFSKFFHQRYTRLGDPQLKSWFGTTFACNGWLLSHIFINFLDHKRIWIAECWFRAKLIIPAMGFASFLWIPPSHRTRNLTRVLPLFAQHLSFSASTWPSLKWKFDRQMKMIAIHCSKWTHQKSWCWTQVQLQLAI